MPTKALSDDRSRMNDLRAKLIGLGESNIAKSYYPELQNRLRQLEYFRAMLDIGQDAIFLVDPDSLVINDVAGAAGMMLRCENDELVGLPLTDLLPDPAGREFAALISSGRPATAFEVALLRPTDKRPSGVTVEMTARVHRHEDIRAAVIIARDVTQRRKAEAELRESEAKYRSLIEGSGEGYVLVSAGGTATEVNESLCRMLGRSRDELIGRSPLDFVVPEDRGTLAAQMASAAKSLYRSYEIRLQHSSGGLVHAHVSATTLRNPSGAVTGSFAFISDMTAQNLAFTELDMSLRRYRSLFEAANDAIFIVDGMTITECNARAAMMFGATLPEIIGKTYLDLSPTIQSDGESSKEKAQRILKRVHAGEAASFEWTHRRIDGEVFETEVALSRIVLPDHTLLQAIVRDVTEKKRIQNLMVQTEKMMSVGGLAAGTAHELNNPLGIIMQAAQNLERRVSPHLAANVKAAAEAGIDMEAMKSYLRSRGITDYILAIREAGERAAHIIRSMLDFTRSGQSSRASCDLNALIDNALLLAGKDYDLRKRFDFRHIVIEKAYAQGLPEVQCAETDVIQAFLNIIKNAAQAMAEKTCGEAARIVITTSLCAGFVKASFEDNGPGLDETTRRRVFEPFFTTKAPGEGTGLGLAVAYFIIVQKHKGRISVESVPGQGARFIVELPLDRHAAESLHAECPNDNARS